MLTRRAGCGSILSGGIFMRRADRWILLAALAVLTCLCAWARFAGRMEELVPLAPIASVQNASLARGGYLIDVNAADANMLSTLPGIGDTLAARIVAYRQEHGPFACVEALDEVPGIGEGKLRAVRRFLTVE